ncbi:FtsX-like permease family protein [Spiroplasma sp. DGKH1]|uniref:ABC transporter permease n=1 Tax=Spiroplasma sp. DGKH1 TaxID=3050074 RepID=UPI0034C68B5E
MKRGRGICIKKLIKNSIQNLYKKILNYLSIFILLLLSVAVFGGMFTYNSQLDHLYNQALINSKRYDVHVNLNKLDLNTFTYSKIANDWVGFDNFAGNDKAASDWINFITQTNNNKSVCFDSTSNDGLDKLFDKFISDNGLTFKPGKTKAMFLRDIKLLNCNYVSYSFNKLIKTNANPNLHLPAWDLVVNNSTDLVVDNIDYHLVNAYQNSSDAIWTNPNLNIPYINKGLVTADNITDGQIIVNRYFLEEMNYSLGNGIIIGKDSDGNPNYYQIMGEGYAYSDIMYQTFGAASGNFAGSGNVKTALVYMTNNDFNKIMSYNPSLTNNYQGYLKFAPEDDFNQAYNYLNELIFNYFTASWYQIITQYNDVGEAGQQQTFIQLNYIMFSVVCLAASIVVLVIVYFFIKRDIKSQRKTLGILKALGYHTPELSFGVVVPIIITIFVACLFGYLGSLGVSAYFTILNKPVALLPFDNVYNNWIIFAVFIIGFPTIFASITYLITIIILRTKPLDLINERERVKVKRSKQLVKYVRKPLIFLPFGIRLTTSFAQKSISKWFTVLITFLFGCLVLLFEFNVIDLFNGYINDLMRSYGHNVTQIVNLPSQFQYQTSTKPNQHLEIDYNPDKWNYTWLEQQEISSSLAWSAFNCSYEWSNQNLPIHFRDRQDKEGVIDPNIQDILQRSMMNVCMNGDYLKQAVHSGSFKQLIDILKTMIPPNQVVALTTFLQSAKAASQLPNVAFSKFVIDKKLDLSMLNSALTPNAISADTKIKRADVYGLDPNSDFKDYFNFNDKTSNIDQIFTPINLTTDPIPIVVAKRIWYSGEVPINSPFEWNLRITPSDSIKVKVKIVGYVTNDTSTQNIFMNIQTLRRLMGVHNPNDPNDDTWFDSHPYFGNNVIISRRANSFQPEAFLTMFSKLGTASANYQFFATPPGATQPALVMKSMLNMSILNGQNTISPLKMVQEALEKVFGNVILLLEITAIFTFIIVAFILVVLINMTIEENKIIMATMKAMGYSNGKVLTYVLAWYIFAFAIGLGLPFLISYGAWIIIVRLIFNMTGILFTFAFSWQSIVIVVLALLALTVAETVFILLRMKKHRLIDLTKG